MGLFWKYKHVMLVVLFMILSVQIGSIITSATTNDHQTTNLAATDSDNKNGSEPKSDASKNVT